MICAQLVSFVVMRQPNQACFSLKFNLGLVGNTWPGMLQLAEADGAFVAGRKAVSLGGHGLAPATPQNSLKRSFARSFSVLVPRNEVGETSATVQYDKNRTRLDLDSVETLESSPSWPDAQPRSQDLFISPVRPTASPGSLRLAQLSPKVPSQTQTQAMSTQPRVAPSQAPVRRAPTESARESHRESGSDVETGDNQPEKFDKYYHRTFDRIANVCEWGGFDLLACNSGAQDAAVLQAQSWIQPGIQRGIEVVAIGVGASLVYTRESTCPPNSQLSPKVFYCRFLKLCPNDFLKR